MINNELKEAKKELLHVRLKNALRVTTKATAIILSFVLPPVLIGYGLGRFVGRGCYYYEAVSVDNNGNEESLGLVENKKNNVIRVYTSCNKTEDGYVKTYDDYSKEDIDSTVFSYIHNKDDLSVMLGTPVDNGYEIDDKEIDLDKEYAYIIEYRKTDEKVEDALSAKGIFTGALVGLCVDVAAARMEIDSEPFNKVDKAFGYVDGYDIRMVKDKVKTLKKKKEE